METKNICGIDVNLAKYKSKIKIIFSYNGKFYTKLYTEKNIEEKIKKFIMSLESLMINKYRKIQEEKEKITEKLKESKEKYLKGLEKKKEEKEKFFKKYGTYEEYIKIHKKCIDKNETYDICYNVINKNFHLDSCDSHEGCIAANNIKFCPYCGGKLKKPELKSRN